MTAPTIVTDWHVSTSGKLNVYQIKPNRSKPASSPRLAASSQDIARALDDYRRAIPDGAHTRIPEVTLVAPQTLRAAMHIVGDVLPGSLMRTLRANLHAASISHRDVALVHYHTDAGGHWLMASVRPYLLGEGCDGTRDRELYYLLGDFLHHVLAHPDDYPGFPRSRDALADLWLTAYGWRLQGMEPDAAMAETDSLRARGRACLDGRALDNIGDEPAALVRFDPAWPTDQVHKLLRDAYDMNHRSLVQALETWLDVEHT